MVVSTSCNTSPHTCLRAWICLHIPGQDEQHHCKYCKEFVNSTIWRMERHPSCQTHDIWLQLGASCLLPSSPLYATAPGMPHPNLGTPLIQVNTHDFDLHWAKCVERANLVNQSYQNHAPQWCACYLFYQLVIRTQHTRHTWSTYSVCRPMKDLVARGLIKTIKEWPMKLLNEK